MTGSNHAPPFLIRMRHRKAHDGCPLMPERYKGAPSPPPPAGADATDRVSIRLSGPQREDRLKVDTGTREVLRVQVRTSRI